MATRTLEVVISAKDLFSKSMTKAQQLAVKTGQKFQKLGRSITSVRGALLSLGALTVFNTMIKKAEDFESALADLPKVTDRSLKLIKQDILGISSELGTSTELVEGYYQVMSAGVTDPKKAMDLLTTAAKASKGAHVELSETIKAMTKLMEGFGGELDNVTEASDTLFAIEKVGQTTFSELVPVIGSLAAQSKLLSVNSRELGGSLAQLTLTAGSTAEAATQYQAVLTGLIKPTPIMIELFKKLEFATGEAAIESLGFAGVLKKVQEATGGSSVELGKLFGRKEAIVGFTALASNNFESLEERIIAVGDATGGTSAAFKEWRKTTKSESDIIKADIEKLAIDMEGSLLSIKRGAILAGGAVLSFFDQVGKGLGIAAAKLAGASITDPLDEVNNEIEKAEKKLTGIMNTHGAGRASMLAVQQRKLEQLLFKRKTLIGIETATTQANTKAIVAGIQSEKKAEGLKTEAIKIAAGERKKAIELEKKAKLDAIEAEKIAGAALAKEKIRLKAEEKTQTALEVLEKKSPFGAEAPTAEGMTELEALQFEQQQKLELMRQFAGQKLTLLQETNASEAEIERAGAELKTGFEQQLQDDKIEMREAATASLMGTAANLLAFEAQSSKKAFKLNKLFNIGQAIMNVATGITSALRLPFPANIAAAAKTAAIGFTSLKNIKSAKFGGGGGGGGAVAGGGGGVATTRTPELPIGRPEGKPEIAPQQVNITVKTLTGHIDGVAQEEIVRAVNEAAKRNIKVNLNAVEGTGAFI